MKWITLGTISVAVILTASPGLAEDQQLYTAKEGSLDMFASYVAPERGFSHLFSTDIRHGNWGGGLGANYFPTMNFGLGIDVNIPKNGGTFIDSQTTNLIFRKPLGSSGLSPYLFGGGGKSYDPMNQWIAQAGIGLEYRSSHNMGLIVDGRYVWGQNSGTDIVVLRAGLRFVF
jgi:hypothetical protein